MVVNLNLTVLPTTLPKRRIQLDYDISFEMFYQLLKYFNTQVPILNLNIQILYNKGFYLESLP